MAVNPTTHIMKLMEKLNEGLFEREEAIAAVLLAFLAGHNAFLLGPPGTGKSLISRRISQIFDGAKYFEYLMQKFSTPEDVFGPVSLKALKNDEYHRLTTGYLPDAEVVFLDEIWKANSAILNALLTAINERIFKNGVNIDKIPMISLISASNECPDMNSELAALYDRFSVRIFVPQLRDDDSFFSLLDIDNSEFEIPKNMKISKKNLNTWRSEIAKIKLSSECKQAIRTIRKTLDSEENRIYVSDRRWQKIAQLIKTSAFFNGRTTTALSDLLVLKFTLWDADENRSFVSALVDDVTKVTIDDTKLTQICDSFKAYISKVKEEFTHKCDVFQDQWINVKENTYLLYHNESLNLSILIDTIAGKGYNIDDVEKSNGRNIEDSYYLKEENDGFMIFDKSSHKNVGYFNITPIIKAGDPKPITKKEYETIDIGMSNFRTEYCDYLKGLKKEYENIFFKSNIPSETFQIRPEFIKIEERATNLLNNFSNNITKEDSIESVNTELHSA